MPLYEYRCSSCGHQQEFLQKWSDNPITVCTACGKETFSKMLTAAGFQLKGSGWYATDFKGSGSKPAAKADTAKGEGKSESAASASKSSDAGSKSSEAGGKSSEAGGKSSDAGSKSSEAGGAKAAGGAGGSPACR